VLSIAFVLLPTLTNLDTISLDRARTRDSRFVMAPLFGDKLVWRECGRMIAAAENSPESSERVAVLRGTNRILEGKRIQVFGVVRVIDHPARWICGEMVSPWIEVIVSE
jgi:hypothetical protein